MKTLRNVLLGLMLAIGLASGASAHEPRIGLSIELGYPAYVAPPPVYYAPPPAVIYAPPPPRVYLPSPYVVPSYGYRPYGYDRDHGPRRGWHRHEYRHHHHHH